MVTRDVLDYSLVVENPAEIIGWIDKLKFDAEGYCECGNYLKFNNNNVSLL
tara:strand:- start:377 stop:529 length:153 start_codon:yes stop_codon:yes gene_type:complete